MSSKLYKRLAAEVYRHTSVTIEESKASLLSNRVRRRVRALGLEGPEEYLDLLTSLDSAAAEVAEFIDVVTTHKTSFFRTSSVWDWLLNDLRESPDEWRSFDVWSCASSTGQEPYSLAMAAATVAAERRDLRWSVRATDVAQKTLDFAKSGVYSEREYDGATSVRSDVDVASFFEEAGEDAYRIVPALTRKMRFGQHSLVEPMQGSFDCAFLRNVLIYFSEEDKRAIVDHVVSTLRPGGVLVIGESESLLERGDGLEYVAPCIYRVHK